VEEGPAWSFGSRVSFFGLVNANRKSGSSDQMMPKTYPRIMVSHRRRHVLSRNRTSDSMNIIFNSQMLEGLKSLNNWQVLYLDGLAT
jgi:hypothetical protein